MVGLVAKWLIRSVLFAIILFGMWGCTMLGLNYASLDVENKPAASPDLVPGFDRAAARQTLEDELYGPWPGDLPFEITSRKMIAEDYLEGRGTLEEVMVKIGDGDGARTFPVVLALPNIAKDRPVPLIISQTFSGNCSAFPGLPLSNGNGGTCTGEEFGGWQGWVATQIFGTYIALVPAERYLDAGFAYASFAGWSFVPDSKNNGPAIMGAMDADTQPTSTLMAWAYAFHAVANLFGADERLDETSISALGHSRYGKSALIALAWSDDVAAAIAHQSGFAGAASSRDPSGETLARMAKSYPHWLRPGLSEDLEAGTELTLDQHYLLALSSPKPMFLGNGRRDVWSGPNSTYRMALAANAIYEADGAQGLTGQSMRDFDPAAEISYWLRVGGHSVVSEDIDAFIAFKSAHFGKSGSAGAALQTSQ